jgi:hypothetical protein
VSPKDSDYINKCRKQIEKKLNWLDTNQLKQSDFQYLGDLVFEKTKTQLSLSTIKRFWDDSYNKSFQITTLNALARFLDYENWHQFKEKNSEEAANTKVLLKDIKSYSNLELKSKRLKILIISIVVLIFLFVVFSIFNKKPNEAENAKIANTLVFTSKKSVKEGVPNTIIFNYDVGAYNADSVCIQLSWNVREREKIEKDDHYYTCTYYYPGYHHAKLIVDEDIVKEHNVHITTKDWLTLVRYQPDDVLPIYIRDKEVISDGTMYASPYLLKLNNVDLTDRSFFVSYFNIREFEGVSGNNFSFETKIKNNHIEPELICKNCFIFIYCETGAIVLPISTKGCVSDISLRVSDVMISGKTNDLSGFGCDLSEWRKISGEVVNKNMKISIDDKKVYELSFNQSLGKIMGWHYFFKGCGAVEYLNLYDSTKNVVYQDNFIR